MLSRLKILIPVLFITLSQANILSAEPLTKEVISPIPGINTNLIPNTVCNEANNSRMFEIKRFDSIEFINKNPQFKHITGRVNLLLTIDTKGNVSDIQLRSIEPSNLPMEPVIEALKKLTYIPPRINCKFIEFKLIYVIVW